MSIFPPYFLSFSLSSFSLSSTSVSFASFHLPPPNYFSPPQPHSGHGPWGRGAPVPVELINSSKAQAGAGWRAGPRDSLWGGLPHPLWSWRLGARRGSLPAVGAGQFPWIPFGVMLRSPLNGWITPFFTWALLVGNLDAWLLVGKGP